MITDRTLLAYEQFCENYYDFSISSRAADVTEDMNIAVTDDLSRSLDRHKKLIGAHGMFRNIPQLYRMGFPIGYKDGYTGYKVSPRVANKIRMKRDPEYREKRLAEIADRKAKNRAAHELGQSRARERSNS